MVLLEGAEALERNEEVETEVLDLRQAGERFFFRIIYFLYVFFWMIGFRMTFWDDWIFLDGWS